MIRLIRRRLQLLGAVGATRNAEVVLLDRYREEQTVAILTARLRHPSMSDVPERPTAA